ncbi:nuclear transport factor 2 family protein [Microbacterium resistens]|uniref:nuclear transport factor 2 family protein n=1 Tax=Microbacterium resistens TaxID=156977 RepID=UPI001C58EC5F|nr:nuclear transport factor 2 family protein [Microbacterium resistens]MBW1637913.1 nuclear transport factor 2 family protein [Microbacterium resistens]
MRITDVEDRLSLRDLVESYARCADERAGAELAALFLPDGVLRAPDGTHTGRAEIATAIARLDRFVETFHFLGNHRSVLLGDEATGETSCTAHHLLSNEDGHVDLTLLIRYHDRFRRTAQGWRFAEREIRVAWSVRHPVRR